MAKEKKRQQQHNAKVNANANNARSQQNNPLSNLNSHSELVNRRPPADDLEFLEQEEEMKANGDVPMNEEGSASNDDWSDDEDDDFRDDQVVNGVNIIGNMPDDDYRSQHQSRTGAFNNLTNTMAKQSRSPNVPVYSMKKAVGQRRRNQAQR